MFALSMHSTKELQLLGDSRGLAPGLHFVSKLSLTTAYYVGGGGKLPPLEAGGEIIPQSSVHGFFWLEIWSFHVANWL